MTTKIMLLFTRKPGMTPQAFRDYYETHHATLSVRLLPFFKSYTRNYVQHDQDYQPGGTPKPGPDFDVAVEITFETKADFDGMMKAFVDPAIWKQIDEDMNKFVDRSKSKTFFIEEVETPKAKLKAFA
jgi:uncharacterized protein (TIGR02118 family)